MDRNKLGLSVKNSIMMEDLKFKFLGLINKQVNVKKITANIENGKSYDFLIPESAKNSLDGSES